MEYAITSFKKYNVDVYSFISSNFPKTIEFCGRTCYHVEDKMGQSTWLDYIFKRIKSGHESIIEHNQLTMLFVDRGLDNDVLNELLEYFSLSNDNAPSLFYIHKDLTSFDYGRGETKDIRYLIVSGNLRMFRDKLKYSYKNEMKYHNAIYDIFMSLIIQTSSNLFTHDLSKIPNYYPNTGLNKTSFHSISETYDVSFYNIYDKNSISVDIINMDDLTKVVKELPKDVRDIILINYNMFVSVTYRVTIPRIISQQDSRHRIQAMSQKSQRYVNESGLKTPSGFYIPDSIDSEKKYDVNLGSIGNTLHISYEDYMRLGIELYNEMISHDKIKKEVARFVLPNSMLTTYCLTKPAYTLNHYFKERCSPAAQYEIREVANALYDFIITDTPCSLDAKVKENIDEWRKKH